MDISVETLQGFLDDAWDAAIDGAGTLRTQLRSYESQVTSLFSASGSISSVSKNSTSQSYRGPGVGSYTTAQIQSAWRMLINEYDFSKKQCDYFNYLSINDPANTNGQNFASDFPDYANDPDQAVYADMKYRLQPCTEYQCDLTDLRLKPTLTSPSLTW